MGFPPPGMDPGRAAALGMMGGGGRGMGRGGGGRGMGRGGARIPRGIKPDDGDWLCPDAACGNWNFARRLECNRCGKANPTPPANKPKTAPYGNPRFKEGDWKCPMCGNINWERRKQCNMCQTPKPGVGVEKRDGIGGGFNERQDSGDYKQRDSSDEEFDDMGRRKKKKKIKARVAVDEFGYRLKPKTKKNKKKKRGDSREPQRRDEGKRDSRRRRGDSRSRSRSRDRRRRRSDSRDSRDSRSPARRRR